MQKRLAWLLSLLLCAVGTGGVLAEAADTSTSVYQAGEIVTSEAEQEAGNPIFVITMEDGSVMRGELYPDVAPESVGNFIALANSGFYDGLVFHRVIEGFMIQGGDPEGTGGGGPGWNIKGEFADNGVANDISHDLGVLSMARTPAPDSAGSQFFIVTGNAKHLDGQYAAFGRLLEGQEVANAIASTPVVGSDPVTPQVMKTVRVETFGVEYPYTPL